MRDTDVLTLKVRRPNAPGLKPPINGYSDTIHTGHYHCDNSPLSSDSGWYPGISRFLEDYFEMPIIDQTGLTQNFHIDLKWEELGKQRDPDHDALKQALLDQLGLELVPSNMPVEMLVVERAAKQSRKRTSNANDMDLVRAYAARNSELALNQIIRNPRKAAGENP
jgi:hypothetical protein